jgi:signal transduction histidine kinase
MDKKARARILVIDDEPLQCEVVQEMFNRQGYVCEATTSPFEALGRIYRDHYDLVVSDIKMEEKDGLELIREIRSQHPDLDIIIMTGYSDQYLYEHIIDAGAADFIAKPFHAGELLTKVRRIEREKQTECELMAHRDHLEKLVEDRTTELVRANQLLQKEIEDRIGVEHALRKSEGRVRQLNEHILHMLMVMSHDIRGPLVAVAAMVKLLLRGVYGKLDESVGNTVKDLLSRIVQVLGIAEDCLGKAHAVNGSIKLEREILDLRQGIIDPILDELSYEIEKHGITIDNRLGSIPAGIILIKANKTWLKAVFRNLFGNAIKYGGIGCTIAFGFEDHGSCYRLNVYNSGRSIGEEHQEKLFTRFGRIDDSSAGSAEGMGLGLYLIKEIVRKHGGDIWYEAKPNGSDFIFTLPKD